MQCLVDRMGISRQSLYDTFGNKRSLYLDALRCYRHEVVEPRLRRLSAEDRDAVELLSEFLQGIVDGWLPELRGCLLLRAATEVRPEDGAVGQLLQKNLERMLEVLQGVIERGQSLGSIDDSRPAAEVAARLLTLAAGLHVLGTEVAGLTSVDRIVTEFLAAGRQAA